MAIDVSSSGNDGLCLAPEIKGKKGIPRLIHVLAEDRPDLVDEWHEKNERSPDEVSTQCNDRAWWRCRDCGHEWRTKVFHRTRNPRKGRLQGSGCPKCRKQRRAKKR